MKFLYSWQKLTLLLVGQLMICLECIKVFHELKFYPPNCSLSITTCQHMGVSLFFKFCRSSHCLLRSIHVKSRHRWSGSFCVVFLLTWWQNFFHGSRPPYHAMNVRICTSTWARWYQKRSFCSRWGFLFMGYHFKMVYLEILCWHQVLWREGCIFLDGRGKSFCLQR